MYDGHWPWTCCLDDALAVSPAPAWDASQFLTLTLRFESVYALYGQDKRILALLVSLFIFQFAVQGWLLAYAMRMDDLTAAEQHIADAAF